MDVLAICYSIRKSHQASAYTLQRFNCYFLCSTILAILSRRAGGWEQVVTDETWTTTVIDSLNELSRTNHWDPAGYFSIGVCSLIDPETPTSNSGRFIHDALRAEFAGARARNSVNTAIAGVLWEKRLPDAMRAGLRNHIQAAARVALRNTNSCATLLRMLLENDENEQHSLDSANNPLIQKTVTREIQTGWASVVEKMYRAQQRNYRMHWAKSRRSPGALLFTSIVGPWYGYARMWSAVYKSNMVDGLQFSRAAKVRLAFSSATVGAKVGKYILFNSAGPEPQTAALEDFTIFEQITTDHIVSGLHRAIQPVLGEREITLAFVRSYLGQGIWKYCLELCVSGIVCKYLLALFGQGSRNIWVRIARRDFALWTLVDFQRHLRQYIQVNANRVGSAGLAGAHFVQDDIENAISEVWGSLPPGFGGALPTSENQSWTVMSSPASNVSPRPIEDWLRNPHFRK